MIEITAQQREQLCAIFNACIPGVEVWAFGSRVRGTSKSSSDLDVALYAATPIPLQSLALLEVALEEAPLPFRVDCVDMGGISDDFRRIIESQRERLC